MAGTSGCCAIVDPAMGEAEAASVATQFKALSDATRVRMLNLLARNPELCVCELQAHFELAQPTISHHLGILRRAGLVTSEERGRWAFYRADPDAIRVLAQVLEVDR
ncbi:MAG TPA: metalloregulator ArsR/SmtB family transcription factor [Actinomycetota bacterium]|nr:metalloregulator ArsR/SmtB family transcription factor [Actinomycetota bacterium]